ncbi:MAG: phage major capsid protein, P2 family [Gammaproteobacteria bacterium]|nr:phage major capsid protein, P2 family [Gammaproteobacteria bacterium]
MLEFTRQQYNQFLADQAQNNGIVDATKKFAATPSVEQKLETRIQQSAGFLKRVNFIGVNDQSGQKVGLSIGSTIAGRTDTDTTDRATQDPSSLDPNQYDCKQTNFDTHVKYALLDAWAKFPDFQIRLRDAQMLQQARDRIMIGFNGTSAAVQTNRVTNPLLQDVNVGWVAKLQAEAPARYLTEGGKAAGEIRVGAGNGTTLLPDYTNLDALVYDMRSSLLDPWHARDNTFVAICSSDLVDEKYFPMIETFAETPTEANALDLMVSHKKLGGVMVAEAPFFPARTIMITRLGENDSSNLSIYYQNGKRRLMYIDNPKRDRIETYESANEAYVIEDLGACCVAVNIKIWDGTAFN